MNPSQLFLGVLFGLIGTGYCWSGKRKGNGRLFICGLALGIFPYFVSNIWALIGLGILLTGYPIFFRE